MASGAVGLAAGLGRAGPASQSACAVAGGAGAGLGSRAGGCRHRDGEDRGLKGVSPVLRDLAVLTPPLLVCAAFLIAVGAFLRHEMGASRRRRDRDASGDISRDGTIPDTASSQASRQSDDEDASGTD